MLLPFNFWAFVCGKQQRHVHLIILLNMDGIAVWCVPDNELAACPGFQLNCEFKVYLPPWWMGGRSIVRWRGRVHGGVGPVVGWGPGG